MNIFKALLVLLVITTCASLPGLAKAEHAAAHYTVHYSMHI